MRKKIILKITFVAIFSALSFVLKKFSFDTGVFRISLFDTPLILVGILTGPFFGLAASFISDFLYSIYSGYAYSFIMMFAALLWGVLGGLFYKRNIKFIPLLFGVLITSIIATLINSIQLYLWYGLGGLIDGLLKRVVLMFIKWPITTTLVYFLYNKVIKKIINKLT